MLKLILGRAGSGKTEYFKRRMSALVSEGKSGIILLTPEQISFDTERDLLAMFGRSNKDNVTVMTFRRICDSIFREYGGFAGETLSTGGKIILMNIALCEIADQLKIYKRQADRVSFAKAAVKLVSEFKNSLVTPQALLLAADTMESSKQKDKILDIALIYETYNALIEKEYLDTDDDLRRASELLQDGMFTGKTVMIDGFSNFTGTEVEIVRKIIREADTVYVALTCDEDIYKDDEDVFATSRITARRLISIAREEGVPVEKPTVLNQITRFANEELSLLEMRMANRPCDHKIESNIAVNVACANSFGDEAEYVAVKICDMWINKGYDLDDITVVTTDPECYEPLLVRSFKKYNIPFYLNKKIRADNKPLSMMLSYALSAVSNSFNTQDVLGFLKTGFLEVDDEDVALFEDYLFVWNVKGSGLKKEFDKNPSGFKGTLSDSDAEKLKRINAVRERVMVPLTELLRSISGKSGAECAAGVYDFLNSINVCKKLEADAQRLFEEGNRDESEETVKTLSLIHI